jgi:hypothetical protein
MPLAEPLLCKLCGCLVIVGRGHDLCSSHQVWSGFVAMEERQREADADEEATLVRYYWNRRIR